MTEAEATQWFDSLNSNQLKQPPRMVEMVDTADLKSAASVQGRAGSTPAPGTINKTAVKVSSKRKAG